MAGGVLFAGPRRVADLSRDEVPHVDRAGVGDGERHVEDRTAQRTPDIQRDDAAIAEQRVGFIAKRDREEVASVALQ